MAVKRPVIDDYPDSCYERLEGVGQPPAKCHRNSYVSPPMAVVDDWAGGHVVMSYQPARGAPGDCDDDLGYGRSPRCARDEDSTSPRYMIDESRSNNEHAGATEGNPGSCPSEKKGK